MKFLTSLLLGFFFVHSLFSCSHAMRGSRLEGDTLVFRYAKNICMVDYGDYAVAALTDPWHEGRTLHQYILVQADKPMPANLPEGSVVRTPLSRAIVFTTVHTALLHELGLLGNIAGVADLKYIKDDTIRQLCRTGRMADCGNAMSPDVERIIDTRPDALLLSPFENSGGYGKLEQTGIPIIECAEYMEPTALGRAEWMRFYGRLFGQGNRADSVFEAIDRNYQHICHTAARRPNKVLVDKVTGSVWYVPGGRSTIAQLIRDAGGNYAFADNDQSGSVALSFETVLNRASDATVWIYRYNGQENLTSEHAGYDQFQAFQTGNVWGCDVGGTRFYEETPFHPDRLLEEFANIIGATGKPTRYFFKR